jgi:hypothetical protein
MTSLTGLLPKRALVRQIRERGDGTRLETMLDKNPRDARVHRRRASGAIDLPVLRSQLRSAYCITTAVAEKLS